MILPDALDVNELYQQKGWTDGLPIVPAYGGTRLSMPAGGRSGRRGLVGVERIRQRPITQRKFAINAVMAGCQPAYMPVIVAFTYHVPGAVNMHGSTASTGAVRRLWW